MVNSGTDPVVANQLRRIVLTIGEGGKATLEDGGVPREGQMTRDGARLKFEVLTVAGINIDKQPTDQPRMLDFTLQKDGTILYTDSTLVRQP